MNSSQLTVSSLDVSNADGRTVRSFSPSLATGTLIKIDHIVPLNGLAAGGDLLRVTLADGPAKASRESGLVIR